MGRNEGGGQKDEVKEKQERKRLRVRGKKKEVEN